LASAVAIDPEINSEEIIVRFNVESLKNGIVTIDKNADFITISSNIY
jgi:hypothetical protein